MKFVFFTFRVNLLATSDWFDSHNIISHKVCELHVRLYSHIFLPINWIDWKMRVFFVDTPWLKQWKTVQTNVVTFVIKMLRSAKWPNLPKLALHIIMMSCVRKYYSSLVYEIYCPQSHTPNLKTRKSTELSENSNCSPEHTHDRP